MGILRIATVVAVGVALLPSDPEKQAELYQRASATSTWVMTFCDRNAATCAQGENLWQQFVAKAEFGAKLAYDAMREGQAAEGTTTRFAPAVYKETGRGTLTDADRTPTWRGHPDRKGSI